MRAESDVFIVGGGINGVGLAVDAAGRGLTVSLCEKGDLASGTSSASSKLIHGGLRYLEQYEFGMVRAALAEREILLRKAPHLIQPLEFVFPYAKHLRPAWLIRLGLYFYDHLAAHPSLPSSRKIHFKHDPRGLPLKSEYILGFSYYDCHTDDARLVVTNALAAIALGAEIQTRTECIAAEKVGCGWQLQLKNHRTQAITTHHTKVLINATGPYLPQFQKQIHTGLDAIDVPVQLIKGSHIVIPKIYAGDQAYILQSTDKRVVFAIPYQQDYTLIGTTDIAYDEDVSRVHATPAEIAYLCALTNTYFQHQIKPEDIVWSYAGVRCLQSEDKNRPSDISRDYKFDFDAELQLLTIVSGKLTTYRKLSEIAIDSLRAVYPDLKPAWTSNAVLPGGDFPDRSFSRFYQECRQEFAWLPEQLLLRYAQSYGTRLHQLLENCKTLTDLGTEMTHDLYEKEIHYLCEHEWAETSEDILWRRTKLGLKATLLQIDKLNSYLSSFLKQ